MKNKFRLVNVRASRRLFIPSILASALALALSVKTSQAASETWDGGGASGIWGGVNNWVSNVAASGASNTATFANTYGTYANQYNIIVNTAVTIGNISFTGTTNDITISQSNSSVFTLAVSSGSPAVTVGTAARTLSITAPISGAAGLTKAGAGTLVLSNANPVTGAVVVSAGALRAISNAGALGAGTLSLGAGTLQLANDTALTFGRNTTVTASTTLTADALTSSDNSVTHTLGTLSIGAQTLNITRGNNITNAGIGGITFGNATQSAAATLAPAANTLLTLGGTTGLSTFTMTKSGAGEMTATGVVSGTKTVATNAISITNGLLTLSGANTFTGDILVDGASSVFAMAGKASPGTFTTSAPYGRAGNLFKQLLLKNGGTFRLTSGTFNNNVPSATNTAAGIIFNIGTGDGILDIASGATLVIDDGTGTGTASAASQLQGSGNLTKTGLGTFQFDDSTAYAGTITVTAGLLQPASVNAFGSSAAGTTIQSGAALNANGVTMTNAEPLTINGTGLASEPVGALTNASGTAATWAGPITLGSASTIGSSAGGGIILGTGATVALGSNTLTLTNTSTGRLFTDGVISGTGAVIMNSSGAGDWVPRADHTYSGGTTLTAGLIAVDRDSIGSPGSLTSGPFGIGTLTISGGQMRAGTGANRTVGNDVTISGNTTFYSVAGEKNLTFTGPVTLSGASRTLTANFGTTVAGTTTIFNGAIGDGGNNYGLIKVGTGNLTLGGVNTYSGGTTVNSGTLNVTGSLLTNTALTVSPSGLEGVTFSLTSGTANPLSNVSALTYGSAAGSTNLGFDIGANTAASDSITTPNAAVTTGTVNIGIAALSGIAVGTFDLISAPSGGLSGASYVLTSAPGGFTYTLSTTDTLVQLGVATAAAATGDIFWRGNTNSSWSGISGSNTNWATTAAGTTNAQTNPAAANTVNFSAINANALAGVINTTLDNNFTVNKILFGSDPNGVTAVNIAPGLTPSSSLGVLTVSPTSSSDGLNVASNAGNVTISAPVALGSPQTWTVNGTGLNGSTLNVSGPISGTNALTINGLVTLSAVATTSTYSGATNVSDGSILQGGATNSFSANSAVNLNSTGILRLNGFSNTVPTLIGAGTVQNNHTATAATLTVGDATDFTFSGTLQNGGVGTLGLTKTGAGKLTLSGVNTHTGLATVNAGTLIIGAATALPITNSMTLSGTGTLDLNGFDQTVAAFTSAATTFITNNGAGSGINTLNITTAGPTLTALITDGGTAKTALRINNANADSQITTNTANTFSGGLTLAHNVSGTRLSVKTAITGTPWGASTIIVGESAADKAGILFYTVDNSFDRPIVLNTALGTDFFGIRNDGRAITLSGLITANVDAVFSSNNATASNTNITNKVTGAGGLAIDLSQANVASTKHTVTLNTTPNTNDYMGDTQIGRTNAVPAQTYTATLALGQADQIPHGAGKGNVIVNSNSGTRIGFFSLAGFNETINGLSGNGIVDSITGTPTLTLGDNNATANFSGILQNTAGSTLNVTKIGTGTQTFSGPSTFTGALNVNGGLVAFPNFGSPINNMSAVNLSNGGISYTAAGTQALTSPIVIGASNGTVDVANSAGVFTIASVTSTAGNLIKTGVGTAVISGSTMLNAGAASVAVNAGTLQAGFGTGGVAAISVGATGNLDQRNSTIEALVLGNSAGALTLANGAQLGFELTNTPTNDSIAVGASGTAVTAGVVTLNLYGTVLAGGTYNLITAPSGLSGATYVLGAAPSGFNYTITATDSLVKIDVVAEVPIYWKGLANGSWNTPNIGPDFNWATNAGGGTDAGIPVSTDAVIFSATNAITSGNTITTTLDAAFTVNSLQFTNSPAGITAVTIAEGAGGALTITPSSAANGIRVLAGGGNATISAPLTIGAAQTWDVDTTGSLTISGNTVFTGSVNKTNAGALTLSGNNSGAGAITLSGGTLNLNSATALGTGVFTIGAGTSINSPLAANTLTTNNVQNWNGNFTFTGANDLNLGTGAVTLGSSLIATTSGSVLTVGGAIGDGGNNRGLTKAGPGTMELNGANTFGGGMTLNAGGLILGNNSALGAGIFRINGGNVSANATVVTTNSVEANADFSILGTSALTLGNVTLSANRVITNANTTTTTTLGTISAVAQNLTLSGDGNTIVGSIGTTSGTLTKNGTGALTLLGTNTYTGDTSVASGTFNMTGSLTGNGTATTGSNLFYGTTAGNTVVNVSGNIVNYLKFQGATNASANAAYIQTAGNVNFTSTQTTNPINAVASAGYGYMEITGGSLKANGRFAPSNGAATTGVMYIGGTGTLDHTGGEWFLMSYSPSGDGGRSMLTVDTGGTLNRVGSSNLFGLNMDRSNGYAVLNIVGGSVLNSNRAITFGNGASASITNTSGFLNLAAGTLQIGANMANGNTGAGSTGNSAYLNFAGGTLKAQAALTSAIPVTAANQTFTSTMYGAIDNPGINHDFSGGITVDTNTFDTTLANNLVAPSADGVAQTSLTVTGGSGYIGAPMVQFIGGTLASGGAPAAGYAVVSGGAVTEIVITAPGSYTAAPSVTLTGGGGSGAGVDVGALVANTGGGLNKIGTGILTLSGANTYSGATLVSGGTLQLNGVAAATPTTSAVTVSTGGTLGFTAGTADTLDLTGKSMTLSGGTLAFDLGTGVKDAILVDNFTLSANSAFTFSSLGALDDNYTLVTSVSPITNSGFMISGQTVGRVTLTPTVNANTITIASTIDEGRWNQTGGGDWSVGNPGGPSAPNWDNYKPTVMGDAALFDNAITAPSTVLVDTPHTVAFMRFNNATNAYTIGANGSSNLTLNNGASNAVVTVTAGSHTIAENVGLLSNLVVSPAATTNLTMSGVVSGARNVQVNGAGTLELSGVNTFSGTTTVSKGTLVLSGNRTAQMTTVSVGDVTGNTGTLTVTNGNMTMGSAGSTFLVGNGTASTGILNQTGGTLTTIGNQALVGNGTATGTYNLSGGTLNVNIAGTLGLVLGVNTGATGIFNLSETGSLNMLSTSTLQICRSDNSAASGATGTFSQTGGTATVGILQMGGSSTTPANNANANATLTLTGGTFVATAFNMLSGANNSTSVINIGGTAQVTLPAFPTNAKPLTSTATITFDSGATGFLSPAAASATYMPAGTFNNAYLTANGAKFVVDSGENITIGQVFENALAEDGTLTKDGAGVLALAGANLYTGDTTITAGTLQLGSAGTTGSLDLTSDIINNGTFAINRTNAVVQGTDFGSSLSGTGNVTQAGSGTTTLVAANAYSGVTSINAGTLSIGSVDNIGVASPIGTGDNTNAASNTASLVFNGGTLAFTGASGTTNRGFTMTGAGTINFPAGNNNALTFSGDLTGAGLLTLTGASTVGFHNVLTLSGNNAGFTGNVTATIGGIKITNSTGLGSGTKTITLTNGTAGNPNIQLDGSGGDITLPSTFTYTVSNTGNNGSLVNIAGNNTVAGQINNTSGGGAFKATSLGGNLTISANVTAIITGRSIILAGSSSGTVSGIISNGSTVDLPLQKTGGGIWTLSNVNTYTGNTSVTAGTLLITGSVAGPASVATTGTLGGDGTITGAATVATTGVLSPGNNDADTLNFSSTLTLDAGSEYAVGITGAAPAETDKVIVAGALTANGTIKVTLTGYVPVANDTFDIADVTGSTTGTPTFDFSAAVLTVGLVWDTSTFATDGKIKVISSDPFLAWATANSVDLGKGGDDDGDGVSNLLEFATNADPQSGASGARVYAKMHTLGADNALTYTIATRKDAVFAAEAVAKQRATKDKVQYTVEASNDLITWDSVVVTELSPLDAAAVQTALGAALTAPALGADWEWHTFRTDAGAATDPQDFIRLQVEATP